MLIDSHCHVNFISFKDDADEVIRRSLADDIWLVNVGAQMSTSRRAVETAEQYGEGVYAAVGLHPVHLADDITESVMMNGQEYKFTTRREEFSRDEYKKLARSSKKVMALGESGLDYFYLNSGDKKFEETVQRQKMVFSEFISLSQELDLPLIIHCRGLKNDPDAAYDDILAILERHNPPSLKLRRARGVVHCFGGNLAQARKFIDLGFLIGFTGVVTFTKKAERIQAIAKEIPFDKILVETDAPFLAPEPRRGERNEPSYVKFVAQKIAELKGATLNEAAEVTTRNAKELFCFSPPL